MHTYDFTKIQWKLIKNNQDWIDEIDHMTTINGDEFGTRKPHSSSEYKTPEFPFMVTWEYRYCGGRDEPISFFFDVINAKKLISAA